MRYRAEIADCPAQAATDALTARARPLTDSGARVGVGGQVPEAIQGPNGVAEVIGVAAALVVLLLAFGSVLAAGLPLLMAAFGLGVGLSLITLLAAVTDVNTVSPTLGSMIGLGIGIDYALFVVARHRERLIEGDAPVEAAANANASAGRSVVFAGGTVLIAICGLAFSGIPSFASMGFAAALVVASTVLVSITLLPALLAASGRRVFGRRVRSGRRPASSAAFRSPRAERLARVVVRRPLVSLVAGRSWRCSPSRRPPSTCASARTTLAASARPTRPGRRTTWWRRALGRVRTALSSSWSTAARWARTQVARCTVPSERPRASCRSRRSWSPRTVRRRSSRPPRRRGRSRRARTRSSAGCRRTCPEVRTSPARPRRSWT